MSWKGFQKGLVRTPQNLKHKLKITATEKDELLQDAEERFDSIENLTRKLHEESKRYYLSIHNLLNHQIKFSEVIESLYKPVYGRISDLTEEDLASQSPQSLEGIAASQKYKAQVTELQSLIKPELDMIETKILKPADELLQVTKTIRKMFTKREHKRLDLDRQEQALKKIQDKVDRNAKQEEKMYKVENDYEMAREEHDYYNELLNNELPQLFKLEAGFIKPLFQSFYFMQLNIFYTMHSHMEAMKIPYFDLQEGIIEGFNRKQGDVRAQVESLSLVNFKTKPRSRTVSRGSKSNNDSFEEEFGETFSNDPEARRQRYEQYEREQQEKLEQQAPQGPPRRSGQRSGHYEEEPAPSQPPRRSGQRYDYDEDPVPEYSEPGADYYQGSRSASRSSRQSHQSEPEPPLPRRSGHSQAPEQPHRPETARPPPPPRPQKETFATALYDYTSQNMGDISFRVGDQIKILKKSEDTNDWWTGEVNGQQGYIPGSYVKLLE